MKKNKKMLLFLIFICLCILMLLIYKVINIYAVFQSNVEASVKFENGIWNINLNGTKISTGVQTDFVIDNMTVEDDEHTMPGKISPGLSGNFKILINPENTNVSIKYDIILNEEALENSSLKIISIKEIANGAELIKTAENIYSGVLTVQDIQNGISHEIEMSVEWLDEEQNDESDTKIGTNKENKQFQIPITFHAIQYSGEEIAPVT